MKCEELENSICECENILRSEGVPEKFLLDLHAAAPVFYCFSEWVLRKAQEDGVKRLYFLARDAYIPYLYAQKIATKKNIGIECRYFYCSRRSLRMPCLHLMERREAIELIGVAAQNLTAKKILARVCDESHVDRFLKKAGYYERKDSILSHKERKIFLSILETDDEFCDYYVERSMEEFKTCRAYFEQEKMCEREEIAVVDTGWTGSIQHCIRLILEASGSSVLIRGYYYGLYMVSSDERDGIFRTFDFDLRYSSRSVAKFNNNLLECMAISDDGMTVSYESRDGRQVPVKNGLKKTKDFDIRKNVFETFLNYVLKNFGDMDFSSPKSYEWCRKTMRRVSYKPSKEFVSFYGNVLFSDDLFNEEQKTLVCPLSKEECKKYLLPVRVFNYLFWKKSVYFSFWDYGTIVQSNIGLKFLYRYSILTWEKVRLIRLKRK